MRLDTRYRQVAQVEAAPMLAETILYHPTKQQFCVLNATAAFVWESMKAPSSASELATALLGHFSGVDATEAERGVAETIKRLHDLELIEPLSPEGRNA